MAAASFMSPMPMPFVAVAAARNTVKKKAEQARLTEIFDGAVKMSFRISSEKNPNVIEFGIRRSRKSKNEMVARYKRQRRNDRKRWICVHLQPLLLYI